MDLLIPPPYTATLPSTAPNDPFLSVYSLAVNKITRKKITPPQWHNFFQIWYVSSGEFSCRVADTDYTLKTGDVMLLPPFLQHESDLSGSDMESLCVFRLRIDAENFEYNTFPLASLSYKTAAYKGTVLPLKITFCGEQKDAADTIMEKALTEHGKKQLFSPKRLLSFFMDFLDLYASSATVRLHPKELAKRMEDMHLMRSVVDYITANCALSSLSIDDIAAAMNMSRRNLTKTFRKLIGRSVHSYITSTRLFNAYTELRSTTDSVALIAERCGFSNSSHLSSCFKKEFGSTPLKFRREYSRWQIKYGDAQYRDDIDSMRWFFHPNEAALIRHWTSMNFTKDSHRNNS